MVEVLGLRLKLSVWNQKICDNKLEGTDLHNLDIDKECQCHPCGEDLEQIELYKYGEVIFQINMYIKVQGSISTNWCYYMSESRQSVGLPMQALIKNILGDHLD